MSSDERQEVCDWLQQFGAVPNRTWGYRVEGDQLRVWEFHGERVQDSHLAANCPDGGGRHEFDWGEGVCQVERVL